MSKYIKYAILGVTRPSELRAVLTYTIWHDPKQDITQMEESGYSRETMRKCWEFLVLTSRSFAPVIKELDGDLCRLICLFYLVLRGLDTIEDDMTLPLDTKVQLLQTFHEKLSNPGWNFSGSGPDEKDRQLLVEFDNVIAEVMMLEPDSLAIITRICRSMGHGMAHYAKIAEASTSDYAVETLRDFDLYCHYVAGLVGEGLSGLFSTSGKEAPELGKRLTLSNSMGLMLQKTNIMRDFREDLNEGRLFWPKEIWGKYCEDPKDLYRKAETDPEWQKKALWALSEMVLDAMVHSTDCLDYLTLCKNQSIFNFCAIPQVMAIATLDVCFMNPDVFKKNVKIRKSLAIKLIQKATNPREVARMFTQFAHSIIKRADPADPSYLKLCIAAGQIEQWYENRFPSWLFTSDGKVGEIPEYSDGPEAKMISDARVRQLPTKATAGPTRREVDPDNQKLTRDDYKVLAALFGTIIGFVAVLVGGVFLVVYFLTKDEPATPMGKWFGPGPQASVSSLAGGASPRVEL